MLVRAQGQDHPTGAEGWRLQHDGQTPWKTDVWLWSDEIFEDVRSRSVSESGVRGAHTDHECVEALSADVRAGCVVDAGLLCVGH